MKVLHVLSGLHVGGIESLAFQLIKYFPDSIINELLNTDSSASQMQTSFDELITDRKLHALHNWPPSDGIKLIYKSYILCRDRQPCTLLLYPFNRLSFCIALGAFFARTYNIYVHLGNTAPVNFNERCKWLLLIIGFKLIGAILVPASEAIVSSFNPLPAKYFFPVTIPNGCDTTNIARLARQARRERPVNDFFRIIMVARLDEIKDHATLLRAYALLSPKRCQLVFAGDGPEKCNLEMLCYELGINPSSIFIGLQSNIPKLLGTADVFAFSTTPSEGFGIALIEALSAGLPIVASDVPACREVLENGSAGLLVPSRDVIAWRDALARLIKSRPAREFFQLNAYQYSKNYDSSIIAQRWHQLLSS